jgi:hypothetical protein
MPIVIADLRVEGLRTPEALDEDGETLTQPKGTNKSMKHSHRLIRFAGLWTVAALAGAWIILPPALSAAGQNETQQNPAMAQRSFDSSQEAVKALQAAAQTQDKMALHEIFGPDFDQLLTGDEAQDARNGQKFALALAQSCKPVPEGEDKITLEVGTNQWPMPIPLVKEDGKWHFDTAAGKEEIIARHIGKDELHAIGVCRAYVKAQAQYASMDAGPNGTYALKFKSASGKTDGLYWPAGVNVSASPIGPVLAEAQADGYVNDTGTGPQPFHGYYFRILTRQGPDAPGGKKNYMSEGMLAGGFALVAYPAQWDQSGIMTFIVNQDGNVYERDLGEKTARLARRMKEYNPDGNWKLVQDEGLLSAASE